MTSLIHLGYSKCASSTLQRIFSENDSIIYIDKPELFDGDCKSHNLSVKWMKQAKKKEGGKPVVVSHEHMLLSNIDPVLGISIGGQKEAKDLKKKLDQVFEQYNILLIVREQSKLIFSRYHQYIMQGGVVSLSKFLEIIIPTDNPFKYLDYRFNKILDILHNKENTVICSDVKKINDKKFIASLNDLLGSDMQIGSKKLNSSVSKYGLSLIRMINIVLVKRKETYSKKAVVRGSYFVWFLLVSTIRKLDSFYIRIFGRNSLMDIPAEIKIKNLYAADNAKLLEQYNIDLS